MKKYPLLKFSNSNDLEKIVEARETSRVKVREIVGLSAPMNKIGRPTYLSNDKESCIVAADENGGGCVLPLDSNYIMYQLQHVIKGVRFWCGDNDILNNITPQVFTPSRQACQ